MKAFSLAKFEDKAINEDAALASCHLIAVSDGAGGGGVFAEYWSKYLVENLPVMPITDYSSFDKWVDSIWEPFYNQYEAKAKEVGGMLLSKFYDEGSFATLVAVWKNGVWISYGDSVAFCYNKKTGELQHSFTRLADFNKPPYLINCKDPLTEKGFRVGQFKIDKDCVVFAASDTLAHYILMMYEVNNKELFADEIEEAINALTKNSNFIKTAMALDDVCFKQRVMKKIGNCTHNFLLKSHIQGLIRKGLIGHDDYSLVIM